ncbi:phosphoserine phosphatase SerB [Alteromonas gilva]|uniref:Phosphoserine phosphatase n=1 Tax=Alteromonas gilva TaxID=2987522 RepID=A0ABT5L6R9_9ALTE|nr:phosphoserine phosphatase SerB [Alteromonas gilva]MDC8832760.1 phosphoserine phosphatase SerB [Alteromonas gilva]
MEQQALSTTQRDSASYLRSLLKEYQNLRWDNTYTTLLVNADTSRSDNQLLVSSQLLTAGQLAAIAAQLEPVLQVGAMSLHPHDSLTTATVVVFNITQMDQDKQRVYELLDAAAASHHCEVALVNRNLPTLSEPGLLVMDMDSTVIQIECIDEIAKLAGLGEQVSAVTEQAMRGELDFKESLRSRVECLRGVNVSQLAQIRAGIPLMPGLQNLLAVLQQHGWKIAIASGGFTYFAGYLERRLGLDASRANELEAQNGVLTGNVVGDIVDAEVKAQTVRELAARWQIPMSQTVAMGDGANDLKMMNVAALGVAFEAKPVVNAQADVAIRYSGLDTMLAYLQ